MASSTDPEKAEICTTGTESTSYQSDVEKFAEGAVGEPDSDHEEVERLDPGHLEDLERQHVSQAKLLMSRFVYNGKP